MISSRRLRADVDQEFFDLVQGWRDAYPMRYKEWDALDGPSIPARESAENPESVSVGIEEDGIPVAFLVFRHSGDGWFEIHLESKRGFSAEKFLPVVFEWGWGLFLLGATALYAWVLEPNRPSAKMGESVGLTYDGTVRWQGMFRGKVAKSRRYTLQRSTWLGWDAATREEHGQTETGRNQDYWNATAAVRSEVHAGSDQ